MNNLIWQNWEKLNQKEKIRKIVSAFHIRNKNPKSNTAESIVTFLNGYIIFWRLVKHVKDNDVVSF